MSVVRKARKPQAAGIRFQPVADMRESGCFLLIAHSLERTPLEPTQSGAVQSAFSVVL